MHTQNKRYTMINSNTPIGRDQMFDVCPAIFATEPFSECSAKYQHISTLEVLDALFEENFLPYMIGQTTPRNQDKHDFAKHMIRLRKGDVPNNDGTYNEIVLKNSSDRSSAAILMAGVFRCVCMNGLVAGTIAQEIHVRHSGNHVGDYINGAYTIVDQFDKVNESRELMHDRILTIDEQVEFAEKAVALRWPDETKDAIQPFGLLVARRKEDTHGDLWTTFNKIQENLIKGGQRSYTEQNKWVKVRAVTGLDQVTKLNRGLWDLADQLLVA